jgi:hypothetical protein
MVRIIADEFLTEERDRKYYADHYTCCPPPLFILLITLIEVSSSHWRLRSSRRILPVATCPPSCNVVIQLSAAIVSSISMSLHPHTCYCSQHRLCVILYIYIYIYIHINTDYVPPSIYTHAHVYFSSFISI